LEICDDRVIAKSSLRIAKKPVFVRNKRDGRDSVLNTKGVSARMVSLEEYPDSIEMNRGES
ncbi:MAG: hypothetical protein V4628_14645, partial [Pseudomonadota bacterium]